MAKQSQLEKAIAALEADKAVLELAIAKLRAQLGTRQSQRTKQSKLAAVKRSGSVDGTTANAI